ncbi:bromodomain adjacent to zinc finger domain protein 2B-like isoform X5 [Tachypleus tridentatus]|uniref:bromodomain adjacent to zinc finger domain protein 2B-like isoform X5 n=1 Tax=Tachypleus tridentatus TaxID=6853 RepID=UPI003FD3775B
MVVTMDKHDQNSQSSPKALSSPLLTSVSYRPGTFTLMGSSSAFRPLASSLGAPSNGNQSQQPDARPPTWSTGSHTWWSPAETVPTTSGLLCGNVTPSLPSRYSSSPCGSFKLENVGTIMMDTTFSSDHVPQPRRIVEEMLGHLYAKPPSAEVYHEPGVAVTGVNGSTTAKYSSKIRVNDSLSSEQETSGNKREKCKENGDISSSSANLTNKHAKEANLPVSEGKKKPVTLKQNKTDFRVVSTLSKSSVETEDKTDNPSSPQVAETWKASTNGIQKLVITKTQGKYRKKQLEGAPTRETSSDNESQSEYSNDSSNGSSNSSSNESRSSGASSDSSDIPTHHIQNESKEDTHRHQRSKLRLRKHTKEAETPPTELPDEDNIPEPLNLKARANSPSPAHSGIANTSFLTSDASQEQDSDFMPAPLDLCIKKYETSGLVNLKEQNLTTSKTPVSLPSATDPLVCSVVKKHPSPTGFLLTPGSRRRGRKPKYLIAQESQQKQSQHKKEKNSEMKHRQKQIRLTKKLQALQEKQAAETNTKIIQQLPIASLPSELTICPVTSAAQIKKRKTPESTTNSTFTIVTTNDRIDFQTLGYSSQILGSPDKSSHTVALNMKKVMSYMLPENSPIRSRGRGRPRGRGRGRGRGRPPLDTSCNSFSKGDKSQKNQTKSNLLSESLPKPTRDSKSSSDSEASDSGDNIDDEDDDKSATASTASSGVTSTSGQATKRHSQGGEGSSPKKKRILPDEKEIRIPLEHGWRRQTKIRCFSRSGVRGEVVYYAPCGKKLKNYPEVVRYIHRHGITDITRENFTFSTKINVGEFLERAQDGARENYNLVSEQEVVARIEEVRARKGCLGIQVRRTPQQKAKEEEEKQHQWEKIQIQHRLEQQEEAQHAEEVKIHKRLEKEQEAKESKRQKAEEFRYRKEQEKFLKEQEKLKRLEQLHLERELRNRQIMEEREMKRQQAAIMREQELQKHREMMLMVDLERERRRQHMLLVRALEIRKKHEERERKREELLQEKRMYKEKKMEQRRMELQVIREMKKPVDDMMLKDSVPLPTLNRIPGLKLAGKAFSNTLMVFEFLHNFGDTIGFDMEKFPTLNTFQMGLLNNDEKSEEELLSVVHHLLICAIDDPGVPNRPEAVSVLSQNLRDVDVASNNVSEVLRLYFTALDKTSKMCKWLTEKPFLSLNPTQKSEIMTSLCNNLLCSRGILRQIDSNIETVNNLRRDKWIVEGKLRKLRNIQQIRALKCQIKQESINTSVDNNNGEDLKESKAKQQSFEMGTSIDMNVNTDVKNKRVLSGNETCKTTKGGKDKTKEEDENDDESGNESDATRATSRLSEGEDEELGICDEELGKRIEKLSKQQAQFHSKLSKALQSLRATSFGQDRYHRRYWVLPLSGGIFVEGMESAELENEQFEEQDGILVEKNETDQERIDCRNKVIDKDEFQDAPAKLEVKDKVENLVTPLKLESMEVDTHIDLPEETNKAEVSFKEEITSDKIHENEKKQKTEHLNFEEDKAINIVNEDGMNDKMSNADKGSKGDKAVTSAISNIEIQGVSKHGDTPSYDKTLSKQLKSSQDTVVLLETKRPQSDESVLNSSTASKLAIPKTSSSGTLNIEQNWLLHSPFFASLLAGSMLMNGPLLHGRELNGSYFNLPKTDTAVSSSSFSPLLGLSPGFLSAEQVLKNLAEKQPNQKPWFSVLPRMPCDNTTFSQEAQCKLASLKSSNSSPQKPLSASVNSHLTTKTTSILGTIQESSSQNLSTPIISNSSQSYPATALPFSNLQLGLLNGLPPPLLPNPLLSPVSNSLYHSTSISTTAGSAQLTSTPTSTVSQPINPLLFCSTPTTVSSPSYTPNSMQYGFYSKLNNSIEETSGVHQKVSTESVNHAKLSSLPPEYRKGWWRITDSEQLKTLLNALHPRGIRERHLQRQFQKYFNYACQACTQGHHETTDLEITELDREISKKEGGAPDRDKEDDWSPEVASRMDLGILEQIEVMEEKVAGASMQVKGWKVPPKLTDDSTIKFKAACLMPKKGGDVLSFHRKKPVKHQSKETESIPVEVNESMQTEKVESSISTIDGSTTMNVNSKEECDHASNTEEFSENSSTNKPDNQSEEQNVNPVEIAKERLLLLESAIERRYIRPPLGIITELNLSSFNSSATQHPLVADGEEEDLPRGLLRWRAAVQKCWTADQLAMCLNMLEMCVAWDKSIMRASCQFCHSGANEEMLLLCDGCDKGYHTYCFKPKMETIPDGDWYCYECLNKATGDKVCVLCGKKGKLIVCDLCPKMYHIDCLDPPLSRPPKGKWTCVSCKAQSQPKKNSKQKNALKDKEKEKDKEVPKEKEPTQCKKSENNSSNKSKSNERKEKSKPQINKEFTFARNLLEELEKHEDSWPFLLPVKTKQFPTYKKIIKKPMDLSTIRNKLEGGLYKVKEEFAEEVRLIFDNCETFNEDESPVGRAGHSLRAYFESRWAELNST